MAESDRQIELIDLQNAEWKDIHVGIMGKDFNIKCCNTIIFILKYIIFRNPVIFETRA